MFLTSQILIVVGALVDAASKLVKSKKKMLLLLIFACCIYSSSYIFLQSWAAVISFLSGALRSLVYYFVDKKPTKTNRIVGVTSVSVVTLTSLLVFWSGAKDIFMIIACFALIAAFAQNNMCIIRLGLIITSSCNLVYDILIGSYMAIVIDVILLICIMYSIIMYDILKKKKTNKEELSATDTPNIK